MMRNATRCEWDGRIFVARDVPASAHGRSLNCDGCAGPTLRCCHRLPACTPALRTDGRTVVWVEERPAPAAEGGRA